VRWSPASSASASCDRPAAWRRWRIASPSHGASGRGTAGTVAASTLIRLQTIVYSISLDREHDRSGDVTSPTARCSRSRAIAVGLRIEAMCLATADAQLASADEAARRHRRAQVPEGRRVRQLRTCEPEAADLVVTVPRVQLGDERSTPLPATSRRRSDATVR
jgi:hypothetical protein